MTRKIPKWFGVAILNISATEIFMITLNVLCFILFGSIKQNLYLWSLIVLCDVMILCSHGAWLEANGDRFYGPWRTPTPILVRAIASLVIFILAAEQQQDTVLSTYVWYCVTMAAICHAFYCILITMHETNDSWLAGTNGHIGTPNWISIIRIALSVLVPHLYVLQPFGEASCLIATIVLIAAIATDALDGFLARKLNQTTKAGKAIDPLGDKVIFYPTAVAFVLATDGSAFLPAGLPRIAFYISIAIMLARDALFFIWFFMHYVKIKDGIGASVVDKIRMGFMCIWLASSALALTFAELQTRLAIAGLGFIIVVAIFSIISIGVDYRRIKPLLKNS